MLSDRGLWLTAAVVLGIGPVVGTVALAQPATPSPRVNLRVLVVTDGTPAVEAIRQQLTSEGVATKVIDLKKPSRPRITRAFLSGKLPDGTPEGYFQGVVVPSNNVPALAPDERDSLADYETAFSVRQVDAFVSPNRDVGMSSPIHAGPLDAATVTVTPQARSDAFRYLRGSFTFRPEAAGGGSYGYLSKPLPDTATAAFTPFLTATVPDSGAQGVLAGVYTTSGRERLEINFGFNYHQPEFRYLAHGIVSWLTKGVHLGYWRNYFSVHIDDIFNASARWSTVGRCTPGEANCRPGTLATAPIRMTADDVRHAATWQREHAFTMDMVFNGGAVERFKVDGADPLVTAFKPVVNEFRWINHTFTHRFFGCVQDFTVNPWRCKTDDKGNVIWVDPGAIDHEIKSNIEWANQNGIPIDSAELLTGEHSGMLVRPQQPVDSPILVNALGSHKIRYVGLDASREPALRLVGPALGFPRYPINVFYNVETEAEQVDQYNWLYTAADDGGSGFCENKTTTSCIKPLDPGTGWESHILPSQIRITLSNVLRNDPRVFYLHQSNLTGDRLAYPVIGGVLEAYRSVFAPNTPLDNPRFSAAAEILNQQQIWSKTVASDAVRAYVQGNTVTVTGPTGTKVPITVPPQTRLGPTVFGNPYGGEQSTHMTLSATPTTLVLAATAYGIATSHDPRTTHSVGELRADRRVLLPHRTSARVSEPTARVSEPPRGWVERWVR